jgi:hypothetical protein
MLRTFTGVEGSLKRISAHVVSLGQNLHRYRDEPLFVHFGIVVPCGMEWQRERCRGLRSFRPLHQGMERE